MKHFVRVIVIVVLCAVTTQYAAAIPYGGVEFPQGASSFADQVIAYSNTSGVGPTHDDPTDALGIPNYGSDTNYVSLGDQGSLALKFTDNSLTTSGDSDLDLWVFEIGAAIEPTSVAISTNGTNWIDVGATSGATSGIDIDAYIGPGGVTLWEKYSYVRLIDLLPHQSGYPFEAADIDAVGAISSAPPVGIIPEPATLTLLGVALGAIGLVSRKRPRK